MNVIKTWMDCGDRKFVMNFKNKKHRICNGNCEVNYLKI